MTLVALKYSDICLEPRYSELETRSKADTTVSLGSFTFKLPVIPANMRAVISPELCKSLSDDGYFYIMHRFDVNNYQLLVKAKDEEWKYTSISVGVKKSDHAVVRKIIKAKLSPDFITIDIAHGHSILVKNMITLIKSLDPNIFVIAGNVATPQACADLVNWGADCVKIGIGQGNVCTTKDKTGFTMPMYTCVKNSVQHMPHLRKKSRNPVKVIADGGIKCNGDIAKAINAGADMVMAGSIFSCCQNSPCKSVVIDGKIYKQYFGSASEYNKGHNKHIEGVMKQVSSNNMSYSEKLTEIEQDLQSAISYSGGKNVNCIRSARYYITK
jgi:GMP reductase